jgi:hypothetical protein
MQEHRRLLLEMVAWWEIMDETQKAKVTGIDMVSFENMRHIADRVRNAPSNHLQFNYERVRKQCRAKRGDIKVSTPVAKKAPPVHGEPKDDGIDPKLTKPKK